MLHPVKHPGEVEGALLVLLQYGPLCHVRIWHRHLIVNVEEPHSVPEVKDDRQGAVVLEELAELIGARDGEDVDR